MFIAFFPHLVAGPIVRASQLLPQLRRETKVRLDTNTVLLFMRGLSKKVIVADNVSPFANAVFADPAQWPSPIIWLATLCFSVQIYCDFSGYTDMAIAIARVLGYELPKNFDHPYFARNPSDFWRRWHITLSLWLRDYLYIPLGGNRGTTFATYRNLMVTMLLGGLWHGAAWNFVLWGLWHGMLLVVHRAYRSLFPRPQRGRVRAIASWVTMQYCVLVSWIMFRVGDSSTMLIALRKFVVFNAGSLSSIGLGNTLVFSTMAILAAFAMLHWLSFAGWGVDKILANLPPAPAFASCVVAGLIFFFLWPLSQPPFIYFQF